MDKGQNRRQWLRGMAAGSAAVGAGALTNCGPGGNQTKSTESTQNLSFDAKLKAAIPLQIICHGMLAFELDSKNKRLLIHVPAVDKGDDSQYPHEYWAGPDPTQFQYPKPQLQADETYTMSGAAPAPKVPVDLTRTSNAAFDPAHGCNCSFPDSASSWKYRHCIFILPMPNAYKGYKYSVYTGAGVAPPVFKGDGKTVNNCPAYLSPVPVKQLVSFPLVHVFRYTNWAAGGTRITDSKGIALYSDGDGLKCYIYAEPALMAGTSMSHDHLPHFNRFFPSPLDLQFSSSIGSFSAAADPGDTPWIDPVDLLSLTEVRKGTRRDGDPTTCMSGFGGS